MSAVALVVPVWNERAAVDALCDRLATASQTSEVVVVDGASDDGTNETLKKRSSACGFRVIDAPRGRGTQMNAGAAATTAPTLLFLHADTTLPEGALTSAAHEIDTGAIGGCFRLRIDSSDPRLKLAARIINWRSRVLCSATGDQAMFVARTAFERVGGFRALPLCEDLDLVQRLCGLGRFALCDEHVSTSARRWVKDGVARTIARMWALRIGWHLGVDPVRLGDFYRADAR